MTKYKYFFFYFIIFSSCVYAQSNPQQQINNNVNNAQQQAAEVVAYTQAQADAIKAHCDAVMTSIAATPSRILENMNIETEYSLPIVLSKSINGVDYMLVIESMSITPGGTAKFSGFMRLEIPDGKRLYFKGDNIVFHDKGLSGQARFYLVENVNIDVGDNIKLTIKQGSYAQAGCYGFEKMKIHGDVELNPELAQPVNSTGGVIPNEKLKASFTVEATEISNMLVSVSLNHSFQIKTLPDFIIGASTIVFDNSEETNDATFPTSYISTEMKGPGSPLFRGLYIKSASLTFPDYFKSSGGTRPVISASNIILDDFGLTGSLSGSNLIPLNGGSISSKKLPFSINSAQFYINQNSISYAALQGQVTLPTFDTPQNYKAIIQDSAKYNFQITTTENVEMSAYFAKVNILPNSSFELMLAGSDFELTALLNGDISIEKGATSLANLSFQEMRISTQAPHFSVQDFSLDSEVLNNQVSKKKKSAEKKANGFNCALKKMGLGGYGNGGIKLNIVTDVKLLDISGLAIAGTLGIDIKALLKQESKVIVVAGQSQTIPDAWTFKSDGFAFTDLGLDADAGAFKIKGSVIVYNEDATYGNGFQGSMELTIVPKLVVQATAMFGTVNNFDYFYVDALLILPSGIQVFPGIGLYGLGGGVYYHCKRVTAQTNIALPTSADANPSTYTTVPGVCPTGIQYVPDKNTYLGIKATIVVATYLVPKPFNCKATLEISFNRNNGIDMFSIQGDAYVMTNLGEGSTSAPVYASVFIKYDVEASKLNGEFHIYVNMPPAIVGNKGSNLAGSAYLEFSEKEWFVYIGHPDPNKRIGVNVMSMFDMNAYLCVGSIIPDMPAPDGGEMQEVFDKMLAKGSDADKRMEVIKGGGFIIGASLKANIKSEHSIFYLTIAAGMGFDIMLKDYGEVTCKGRTGLIGINGFYAKGQLYAYLMGKAGMTVDNFIATGKFEVMDIRVAALLRGELPNPTFVKGDVHVKYNLFDGFISGEQDVNFTLGEKCIIDGGLSLSELKIINEIKPAAGSEKVDVFTSPQISFNIKPDKEFQYIDNDDFTHTIRLKFDYFNIYDDKTVLTTTPQWNTDKTSLVIKTTKVLPEYKKITVKARVYFEKKVGTTWEVVKYKDKVQEEVKEHTFTSGEEPEYITDDNILYAYPIPAQFNVYPRQSSTGYIKLEKEVVKPFALAAGFELKGKIRSADGEVKYINLNYNNSENIVTFGIPSDIKKNQAQELMLVKRPTPKTSTAITNVKDQSSQVSVATSVVSVTTKEITSSLLGENEVSIYNIRFKTSKYDTFADKWKAVEKGNAWTWSIMTGVDKVGFNIIGDELFDKYEVSGIEGKFDRLLQFEAEGSSGVNGSPSWTDKVNGLVYPASYPIASGLYLTRDINKLGYFPKKDVYVNYQLSSPCVDKVLTQAEHGYVTFSAPLEGTSIHYHLVITGYNDYVDLRNRGANHALRYSNTYINNLLTKPYSNFLIGEYPIKVKYALPGKPAADIATHILKYQ
ncbi:MAG: hypothetical protein NW207_09635 [Cytophagales bacterium]|nr:hypothetical protein [Cytophagales bacterium]